MPDSAHGHRPAGSNDEIETELRKLSEADEVDRHLVERLLRKTAHSGPPYNKLTAVLQKYPSGKIPGSALR